jgi:hypothetical protein
MRHEPGKALGREFDEVTIETMSKSARLLDLRPQPVADFVPELLLYDAIEMAGIGNLDDRPVLALASGESHTFVAGLRSRPARAVFSPPARPESWRIFTGELHQRAPDKRTAGKATRKPL